MITNHSYRPHPERLFPASLPACAATLMLFLLMHQLIATDTPQLVETGTRIKSPIMEPPQPLTNNDPNPPAKPDEPLPPPEWAPQQLPMDDPVAVVTGNLPVTFEHQNPTLVGSGGGGIVAYLKVQPIYPNRALQRGIQGYVDLAFDITIAGSTTNIRVLEAEPDGVFERAAIKALEKWKYKVPEEDGYAQGQRDMMTRISFSLEG